MTDRSGPRFQVSIHAAWVIYVLLAGLILAVCNLLTITLSILLLVFAGLVFGVFVYQVTDFFSRKLHSPYRLWFCIFLLLFFVVFGAGFYYLGSQVAQKATDLSKQLSDAYTQVQDRIGQYEWAEQVVPSTKEIEQTVSQSSGQIVPAMMKGVQWVTWAGSAGIVILFVGFYAAWEPSLYQKGLVKLFPVSRRDRMQKLLDDLRVAISFWLIGRLVSMAIIAVVTAIALWWMGVPLPITLGVLAGLLTFVPNIGPILAAVPQVLLALNVGTNVVLYVILFNLILQLIESYLITPVIQRHEVSLPPILTITAQFIMGIWIGVIGVMMAAPLVVVIMVLVRNLYIRDSLGDPDPSSVNP